jgi:hypothetical protein
MGMDWFLNAQVGYARTTGYYSNSIYKTNDGGETWQIVFTIDDDITSFHFINESVGYFVGDNGIMYKTINVGGTWQILTPPYKYYIFVKFYSSTLGYILDDYGYLYKTKDGGINWEQSYQEYGISFIGINDLDIFISGDYGSILKSPLYKDLIQLGNLSAIGITDSTATIQSSIKSELALENAKLFLVIGRQSGVYEKSFQIETLNGTANQSISYELKDLFASTNYYCRLKVINGENTIFSREGWFKTLDIGTSINILSKLDKSIKIYPNPTEEFIVIEWDNDFEFSTYEIIDIHGRLLQNGKINNGQNIDFSTFNKGIYILNIIVGNARFTKRAVKQ